MSRRVRTTDLLVVAVASSISGVSRRRNVVQRIIGTTHPSILTSWFSAPPASPVNRLFTPRLVSA